MILFVIFLALILRLINLNQSLWLDEAINVLATKQYGLFDMVTKYSVADFHPPGYFILLWIWTHIGGIDEIWVRLPSVALGVLTVYFTYLLGNELFKRKIGLLGALLIAIAPLHVYYSQEARMYSLATFAAVASFYFFWRLVNYGGKLNKMGYIIMGILALYSDYVVYFIFPAQAFYFLLFQRKKLKIFLLPVVSIVLAITPWLLVFPKQLATGTAAAAGLPGWANVVGGAGIKDLLLVPIKTFFGRISIENKLLYGLAIGFVSLVYSFIVYKGTKSFGKQVMLLICWVTVPLAFAFMVSFFIPVLSYFRMLFILPAFYLLLAKGIDALASQATPGRLMLWGVCMVSLISLGVYYANPKFHREDWKGAVRVVDEEAQVEGLILFENNTLPSPFIYYSQNRSPAMGGLRKIPAETETDINNILNVKNIYLFEYLVDITDPKRLLEKEIEKTGYKRKETLNFNGVGFVHHFQLQ